MITVIDANTGKPILLPSASKAQSEAGASSTIAVTPLGVSQAMIKNGIVNRIGILITDVDATNFIINSTVIVCGINADSVEYYLLTTTETPYPALNSGFGFWKLLEKTPGEVEAIADTTVVRDSNGTGKFVSVLTGFTYYGDGVIFPGALNRALNLPTSQPEGTNVFDPWIGVSLTPDGLDSGVVEVINASISDLYSPSFAGNRNIIFSDNGNTCTFDLSLYSYTLGGKPKVCIYCRGTEGITIIDDIYASFYLNDMQPSDSSFYLGPNQKCELLFDLSQLKWFVLAITNIQ